MVKKSKEKRAAAPNRVAAGKRAVPNQVRNEGPLFPTKEKGFEGFVGFVNKQKRIKQQINKIKV
ncbi:MAG: hypothetical protein IKN08_06480 [Bacteroidales bacterium]|nr:hypothetical protein [Bacteroidales bacterium]MBR6227697.1 hypothetical protein [Bacteroidales bacterium]